MTAAGTRLCEWVEANRPDAAPAGLVAGKTQVPLLAEHGISLRRSACDLLELGEMEDGR